MARMCERQRSLRAGQGFLAMCRDKDLRVATLLPGMQGGLGRDKDFLAPCCYRSSMSRQGLGLGLDAWVATRVPLCRDKVFLRLSHSCHDRRFYVVTRFAGVVLRQRVSSRDPYTRPACVT